ncbi:MOG interacting and ectopic P-granules protein 1-like isoform X2 [Portunus trituberculatus]|uniref:MOG interacting and ectopic P-granules protein 1-like isoform X2 n=1 Tax=Portunus trituberculatus TaxID=210409 RepID=UPI001E1CCC2E|nr:MOG interacting and ectopic P-granules protein 1-like isoform X2 [Portunus trituberculatus]
MSESEATTGVSDIDGEKVKTINGMKEMEEVRMQNGETEKPQINGDVEKREEEIGEEKVQEERNGSVEEAEETSHVEGTDGDTGVKVEGSEGGGGEEGGGRNGEKQEVERKEEKEKVDEKEKEKEKTPATSSSSEEKDTEKEKKEKKKDTVNGDTSTTSTTTTTTSTTTSTPGKKKKHHHDDVQEVISTRQLRIRRTPKKYTEDDDDVKITNEVIKDDSSDIEMIEESDPLAISDAEVKKIQKEKKEITIKTKDPNVIIIDTNTLLKNQGNLAAAVAQSTSSTPVQTLTNRSTSTTTTTTNINIQNAIQAITGGVPAQGLQSAYITALQQVLISQGGQVPMNSQHLSQLQQYYNSLGHLQDDAYVIEAPSFIVPYVMEGKPKEPIKEFLKRINKELEEFERKEKEEEEKREAEERKKKEEEDRQKRKEEREVERKRRIEAGESVEDLDKEEEEEAAALAKEEEEKKEKEKEKEAKAKEEEEGKAKAKEEEEEEDNKENNKTNTNKEDGKKEGDKDGKVQSKEEKKEGETRKGKEEKATEATDEDKENKDKSDAESVVDLEKEKDEEDMSFLGKWEPYYRSALGKFMMELGLNQAQEFLQADLLRMQKRKLEKMKTQPSREGIMAAKLLEKQLEVTRKKNAHLQVPLKICKFCTFKTESMMVMERHLESPHMVNYTYKCNFCDFETRGPQVILFHMEAEHNTRGRLERAPAFFQCSLCPYEDNNKSKMTRHSFSCSKKYKPEKNCELLDWEPPAKIPKIHRGRPNTLGKAFEPVKMPNLMPKNLGMNISIQSGGATNLLHSSTVSIAAGRGRGRPVGSYKNPGPLPSQARGINTVSTGSLLYTNRGTTTTTTVQGSGSQFTLGNQMFHSTARVQRILPSSSSSSPVSLIPGLGASSSITIQPYLPVPTQSVQSKGGNTKSPQQPSISITPLPRAGQQISQGSGNKGSSQGRGDSGGNPSFVICEICDGYIKDLEQLRNHMNLIHKVKIHPKMIYNRPPLNCQKCQHRFFTDQGLERHLLGTHGLVTSSMQEAANKGKDAGRCPICGKVFQWKLLNHVSRDHKMTLKPAHLSYKCTVCTATFNMYRLFENHVYSAHSVVNKNKEGSKKQSSGGSSESPLKINDEITIIPQPVVGKSKSSSSNTNSTSTTTTSSSSSSSSNSSSDKLSSSKKCDTSTPTMSKEITITKVGSRPTRRSGGGGVEVISLDESPKKSSGSESSSSKKRAHKDSVGNNTKKARTSS